MTTTGNDDYQLCKRITRLRNERGYSQRELLDELFAWDCDVSAKQLRRWEQGDDIPKAEKLYALARSLAETPAAFSDLFKELSELRAHDKEIQKARRLRTQRTDISSTNDTGAVDAFSDVDDIPINGDLEISGISYGEGLRAAFTQKEDLQILDAAIRLKNCRAYVGPHVQGCYFLRNLFNAEELNALLANPKVYFPRNITIHGTSIHNDTYVAIYICTDMFYLQKIAQPSVDRMFCMPCIFGREGVSEFVDEANNYLTYSPFVVGNENNKIGSIGVVTAVECRGQQPLWRSRYVVMLRRGIRYPDDEWWLEKT